MFQAVKQSLEWLSVGWTREISHSSAFSLEGHACASRYETFRIDIVNLDLLCFILSGVVLHILWLDFQI